MFDALEKPSVPPVANKREIFAAELLKSGVESQTAMEVARIVADGLPDEQLTSKQRQIVKAACTRWFQAYKRQQFIDKVLQMSGYGYPEA